MKSIIYAILLCLFATGELYAQSHIKYEISFKNAVHHEAEIAVEYDDVVMDTLSVRMSRTSPGRYAIHEFAKNVYAFKAVDGDGNKLKVSRPDPYQWDITGHSGIVKIYYTLFANHGDGTYAQIDETHAHLNIPATFIYAPSLEDRPVKIKFDPRNDLGWKVATQLKLLNENEYYAPNLDYFMDSPVEISNHRIRTFKTRSGNKEYDINFVLHQSDGYEGFDAYFEKVKKIVETEMEIFGALPDFDYGSYYFLACYMTNVDGDGMEHRNSTILTSQASLSNGGDRQNIGTVAHEFFHAWNVERIRPASLEPFDYTEANISGELWFAEGFTSYYTYLTLCRTGIMSKEYYASSLSGPLGSVWNSPGRKYFNPVEMSYQAPFVDAATSVDQVNRENTFISYYTYGNVLGLALDLSLRNLETDKSLDGFMRLVWRTYGKNELPYTLENLQDALTSYTDKSFSDEFFNTYIFGSAMPDYQSLLASVGIGFSELYEDRPVLGAQIQQIDNKWLISSNPTQGASLYNASLSKGDKIVSIDGRLTNNKLKPDVLLNLYKPGESVKVVFNRYGLQKETELTFTKNLSFKTYLIEDPSEKIRQRQNLWLDNTSGKGSSD